MLMVIDNDISSSPLKTSSRIKFVQELYPGILPRNCTQIKFVQELYPGDLDRLAPHLEAAMNAFPCFQEAEIQVKPSNCLRGTNQFAKLRRCVSFSYGHPLVVPISAYWHIHLEVLPTDQRADRGWC